MPGRGSGSTGRRSATGPAAPASIFSRSRRTCASIWPRPTACSWTRPPHRCSIPDGAGRRRASSGRSPPMTEGMAAPVRQSSCSAMRRGAAAPLPKQFLQGFSGQLLQCDGYDGYERLTRIERPQGPWTLVHCWSHLRRRFVKQMRNTKSPIAEAAVRQIAALYAVEATVRGMAPEDRLAARRDLSAPIIERAAALVRKAAVDDLFRLHPGHRHPLRPRSLGGPHPVPR